jgi:plastocyanin
VYENTGMVGRLRAIWGRGRLRAALVLAGVLAAVSLTAAPAAAAVKGVIVVRFLYLPQTQVVQAGDTVIWRNASVNLEGVPLPHTVTSDTGAWSSLFLPPGGTRFHVFTTPGTYPYHCEIHPFMRGAVLVE